MKIDKYTKIVLTIIAVGVIGLNVHFFKDDFVKEAHAVERHDHFTDNIILFKHNVEQIVQRCDIIVYSANDMDIDC